MFDRIFGRLLQALPTLLLSSVLVFLIIRLVPGDPARTLVGYDAPIEEVDAVRVSLGLDQPLAMQYLRWIGRAVRGDFGKSLINRFPVGELVALKFPATLELAIFALLLATAISIGGFEVFTKVALYFFHERSWARIRWGITAGVPRDSSCG